MHPPTFSLDHVLSDWPDCCFEVRCPCSPRMVQVPVRWLRERGDRPFRAVLVALRWSVCRGRPAPVYLVAGFHRTFNGRPAPDWCLELVPAPV